MMEGSSKKHIAVLNQLVAFAEINKEAAYSSFETWIYDAYAKG